MEKKEFAQFTMALKTFYPREAILPNQQAMELWFNELKDLEYLVLETALRKHVQTSKWPPTIAELRELANEIQRGKIKDYGEGWELVILAIRKYGMYQVDLAMEFIKMNDEIAYEATRRLGFKEICMSENTIADRANFRQIYETLQKRATQDKTISSNLQLVMKDILFRLEENKNTGIQYIEEKKEERQEVERPKEKNIEMYMQQIREVLHS